MKADEQEGKSMSLDPWYESDEAYDRGMESLFEAIDSGRYDIVDTEDD